MNTIHEINNIFFKHPVVRIKFHKKNGGTRTIIGTSWETMMPEDKRPNGNGQANYHRAYPVFDLNLQEWRAFSPDSIISIEPLLGDTTAAVAAG